MVNPFQIATQGIGPGWSTFNMTTQGFGFDIEIIIQPSGGGGSPASYWWPGSTLDRYVIIVRVKHRNKTWESIKYVSPILGKHLEKVVASLRNVRKMVESVMVKANLINNVVKQIFVRVKNATWKT